MKPDRLITAAVLILIAVVTGARAQKLLLNPAYLSQFPSVERIRTEMKGSDDVDSFARFMAALDTVNGFLIRDLLQAPNGGYYELPPGAARVQGQYSYALTRYSIDEPQPQSKDPRYNPLRDKYDVDPIFIDGILTKFFTPQFRLDYYAWVRKPVPAATAKGATGPRIAPDPSIAKAKAAKVDTSVFGLALGEPIQIATCKDTMTSVDPNNCIIDPNAESGFGLIDELTKMFGTLGGPADPNLMSVQLNQAHCPSWLSGCSAAVEIHDGVIVSVTVKTQGRKVENSVNAELRAKYGPPTRIAEGKITPDQGNAFDVRDPEWILPGVHVEYQLVIHNEDVGVDTRFGWIRVMTEAAYNRIHNVPLKRKM